MQWNNTIRLKLFEAYRAGAGSMCAERKFNTIEGTVVMMTLEVRDGAAWVVDDFTRDRYGPPGIRRHEVTMLQLGISRKGGWEPLDVPPTSMLPEDELVIRIDRAGKDSSYF